MIAPPMTHSPMIERVARAICHYPTGPSDFNSCCAEPNGRKRCQVQARAALEAMREPSEEMVDAGADADGEEVGCIGITKAEEVWHLMIEAALKDAALKGEG